MIEMLIYTGVFNIFIGSDKLITVLSICQRSSKKNS